MRTSILNSLQERGFDVHGCSSGSDGDCHYLVSERQNQDYGDKDGRVFKAFKETPAGDLRISATLAFFVTRTAQSTSRTRALIGDFEAYLIKAGLVRIRQLLRGDISEAPIQEIVLGSRSPDKDFTIGPEQDPLVEQRNLRHQILRILAEKQSGGLTCVPTDLLLEELCTRIDWVERALTILNEQKFITGNVRGELTLLPAGFLEAERATIGASSSDNPVPAPTRSGELSVVSTMGAKAGENTSHYGFDLFVSYASEDRHTVQVIVSGLEGRGFKVWWDKGQITLGDKLTEKIDEGLRNSRYGVVIISRSFIEKQWPESELRSMINRSTTSGEKVILPVLLGLAHDEFADRYPLLADTVTTEFDGDVDGLVHEISDAIGMRPSVSSETAPVEAMPTREAHNLPDLRHPHGETVSSFLNSNDLLARLIPYGNVTNASDVIWTNRPQAFLRLVPTVAIGPLTPKAVHGLILSPPSFSLPLFGRSEGSWFQANEFGAVAFDAEELGQTSAWQVVQVFENGEIWAIDARILSHERNGQRGIPSTTIEQNFVRALSDFLAFAKDHLGLSLPLRLIGGIDGVKGFSIAVRHGLEGCIVKDNVVYETWIENYDVPPYECLLPLFKMIWEYAGLDRPEKLQTFT